MSGPVLARNDAEGRRLNLRGLRGSALERYWAQTDRSGGLTSCWEWRGARTRAGYGLLMGDDGRLVYAHRVALMFLLQRDIRLGYCACHHCDNRGCANPFHMFEGTRGDNNRDMVAKGRHWSQKRIVA